MKSSHFSSMGYSAASSGKMRGDAEIMETEAPLSRLRRQLPTAVGSLWETGGKLAVSSCAQASPLASPSGKVDTAGDGEIEWQLRKQSTKTGTFPLPPHTAAVRAVPISVHVRPRKWFYIITELYYIAH